MTNPILRSGIVAMTLLVMASIVLAQSAAEVLEPFALTVQDGGTVNLGTIGPGQTLAVTVNGVAPGKGGEQANWGVLGVLETPNGWSGFDSAVFAKRMRATVKADPGAADGVYTVKFRLTECESKSESCEAKQGLGSVTFFGTIRVSKSVLATGMPVTAVTTGVNQPARYTINIENRGNANDVFDISAEGVPAWSFKKSVHVPAGGKLTTFYEMVVNEEKTYLPTITIKSVSSDELKQSYDVSLISKSDLAGDMRATKNGVLLFPMTLEPLYSLMGILGYIV